ncbi:alpha/beta fold hydrolase [Sphingomonas piscis]|uniref:Alpha/beta fold hydrolase n=1 Tax=Sphingomonas piscis TaxID=2714943 RepID=A0A6G7YPU1_9SPHN|nr:alpha/beta fold hydrolase [Sphingomonas piscis]QIK78753.1 alpha/beta fold hydrolase [Sphingomonas piscis]
MAGDRTCIELHRALGEAGWRVHPWRLGLNKRVEPDTLERLERCIDRIGGKEPVLIVGWSLGGLYARELARHCPAKVKAVVTLGSPFSGSLRQNNVWRLYEWVAGHSVDNPPVPRITDKPPVPTLALWSRRDGIVAPRSARGLPLERDREVELGCSHMAFAISKNATRRVAREIELFLNDGGVA